MKSILYIDDEDQALKAFIRNFRREYNVMTTTDAAEAMRLIAEHEPFCVVADQRMPLVEGTTFLEMVAHKHPNIVRVLTSGYSDNEAIKKAINRCGVFYYMDKPWDDAILQSTIHQAERIFVPDHSKSEFGNTLHEADIARRLMQEPRLKVCNSENDGSCSNLVEAVLIDLQSDQRADL